MIVSLESWLNFIQKLGALDDKAAKLIVDYMSEHSVLDNDDKRAFLDYAYAVATKYGEASSSLACDVYDMMAEAQNAHVPPAMPAPTPTYSEVARTVNGASMFSENPEYIGGSVGTLVKRTGVDTTLNNALRDGAEWAWIPHGDTCPFCLMLASNGWQRASKKALRNGHANHIHANCDCTYAIRFDGESTIEGYYPEALYEQYKNAEGRSWNDKINYMRRQNYEANKDSINAQKRAAYRFRNKNKTVETTIIRGKDVTKTYIQDSVPGRGNISYEPGFHNIKGNRDDDIATAKIIHERLGGNIIINAELNGRKNPDYEWMGTLWDLKSTSSEKAANSAIRSGLKQINNNPGGIILNFGEYSPNMDELIKVIELRMGWYKEDSADIIILSQGKILKVLRY